MLFVIVLFASICSEAITEGHKLVIDHDGGADDAMAIFMALLNEKYFDGFKVIALTTTHGNVDESQVFNNTERILGIAGRQDVPVYRGSNFSLLYNVPTDYYFGFDGLGDSSTEFVDYEPLVTQPEHAAIALIDMSKKYQGELTVVALGTLTNIALAIRLDSSFVSRLSQLYIAAGNIYSEENKEPEFNAEMDVESYSIVLENSHPEKVTVIPFSQVRKSLNISREWRQLTLGSIPTDTMRALNVFEQISIVKSETWSLLDPVAMAIVLDESLMIDQTRYAYNNINICENRGININNFTADERFNSRIIYQNKEEAFKQFLVDIFSADLNR